MQQLNDSLKIFENEKIWVNWKYEKDEKGKLTKVPYSAMISGRASSTNPNTWSKFEFLNFTNGIGIVFPLEKTILGIDLDHCLEGLNIVHPEKEKIFDLILEANTYTEISPSKTGLHLWFKLSEPLSLEANSYLVPEGKNKEKYEAYTSGRYFTVTNNPYKEIKPIRTISSKEALELLSIIGYPWAKKEVATNKQLTSVILEDDVLLEKMFASKNGQQIKALYNGDKTAYKDDWSSADMALCSHLAFWTGGNATQMDRLWLKSALSNRDKAITRKDYRPRTIATAIRNCREFYSEDKISSPYVKKEEDSSIVFLKSSEIVSKPIDWLWEGKIAKGKVTMIAGDPGLGKSQASLHFASIVSTGGTFPGGCKCKQGSVLLFSAEDGAEDTINPRLQASGADGDRVFIFSTIKTKDREKFFDISTDLPLLKKSLENNKDISLIVIDPITAFLGETDSHKNSEVRGLLSILSKMAEEHSVAIVVVTHLNKNTGSSAMNKITGSLAFVAAARAAYMVVKDQSDESRRLFLTVKNNLAVDKGGFAYRVEPVNLGNNIGTSKVVWEEGVISMTLAEAMEENSRGESARTETVEWLEDYLKKHPDGATLDVIEREATRAGVASRRTLDRAAKELFIDKIYTGKGKPKLWKLITYDVDTET